MDCKDLKIPFCGPCNYNLLYGSRMSFSHISTKEQFKDYILNTILKAQYIHNIPYLRHTVNKKFPTFLEFFDIMILLK